MSVRAAGEKKITQPRKNTGPRAPTRRRLNLGRNEHADVPSPQPHRGAGRAPGLWGLEGDTLARTVADTLRALHKRAHCSTASLEFIVRAPRQQKTNPSGLIKVRVPPQARPGSPLKSVAGEGSGRAEGCWPALPRPCLHRPSALPFSRNLAITVTLREAAAAPSGRRGNEPVRN